MSDQPTIEPVIERIQALELQPGDVLVVTLPEVATFEAIDHAREYLERRFPSQQILVTTRGVDVAAYRPVPIAIDHPADGTLSPEIEGDGTGQALPPTP